MEHKEMTIQQIADAIAVAERTEKAAKATRKQLESEVQRRFSEQVADQLALRTEPFGTVNIAADGFQVKFEIKKKVEWDQAALGALWSRIENDGAEPSDFLTRETTFKVSETQYKTWGENVRTHFDQARTVKDGGVTVTIKETK